MESSNSRLIRTGVLLGCLVLAFLLSTCTQVRHTYQPATTSVESEEMIFLTFSIKADSLKANRIDLIERKIVTGKLKSDSDNSDLQDRLVVKQLNSKMQELVYCSIDHPLLKRAEYPNGLGGYESKTVKLKEAEFFVRVTLLTETEYIQVDEIVSNKNMNSVTFRLKD